VIAEISCKSGDYAQRGIHNAHRIELSGEESKDMSVFIYALTTGITQGGHQE